MALYARIAHLDRSIPFAILAVILAAAFAAATEALSKREDRPGLQASIALYATGALAALALALTFALEKGWLTIALSLVSLGTAWISLQRPIPFLRTLAAILAGIVVLRIGYEPRIVGSAVGTTPIFNWLLWGYGVPALCFWGGSYFLRRNGDDAPLRSVEAAALLFTVLLAFMEIRHFINNGDVYRESAGLTEVALQVCVALAMAIGLERLRLRSGSIVHEAGAILLTLLAGAATVLGLFMLDNPLIWSIDVGGVVFNLLLLGYALPAVLALLLSYAVAGHRPSSYANTIAAGALVLALAYVTLEIRRLYHGPVLSEGPTTGAEQYTYSIAWLVFGVVLLGIGILVNSQRARLASAVVIALTILKAFLIDMSQLTGIYRALSFMCLGVVLVAIGWLYQRILFRRQERRRLPPPRHPEARSPLTPASRDFVRHEITLPAHHVSGGPAKTFSDHSLDLQQPVAAMTILQKRIHGDAAHDSSRPDDVHRHHVRGTWHLRDARHRCRIGAASQHGLRFSARRERHANPALPRRRDHRCRGRREVHAAKPQQER